MKSNTNINSKRHILFLVIIFLAAAIFNILPRLLTDIPLSQQLSSDAEYHIVHWYEYSKYSDNNFLEDKSFQYDTRPAGDLFIDKIFVRIGESLNIKLTEWSVIISIIALGLFLSGVYAVSSFALNNAFLALMIGLGSIIPTSALGGTTWGFLTSGYRPRELAIGFALWLLLFYLYGKRKNISWTPFAVFFAIGVFANWYPVLFLHFAMVLILADVIQNRKISKEHILCCILFAAGAAFAIFDVVSKAKTTIAPDLNILHIRYEYMYISSFAYGFFRYLRRVIIYLLWIPGLIIFFKKFIKEKAGESLSFWLALWVSAGIIMTTGVLLEQYTVYAKFLFSRTSLFFIFSSMVITSVMLMRAIEHFFPNHRLKKAILSLALLCIFIGQSSIPTIYRHFSSMAKNVGSEKSFREALDVIFRHTISKDVVLANTSYSNKIRAYAKRNTYCSWKDGSESLVDGRAGKEWYERFIKTNEVLQTNNLNTIIEFSRKNDITVLFLETSAIKDAAAIKTHVFYQVGNYTIILLAPEKNKLSTMMAI